MNFYSVRDLRTDTKSMCKNLSSIVQAVRQAKAMIAFNSMRRKAAKAGFLTDEEIHAAIEDVRNGSRK